MLLGGDFQRKKVLLEEYFSNQAWLSLSKVEGMFCAANKHCSVWSGVVCGGAHCFHAPRHFNPLFLGGLSQINPTDLACVWM